MKDEIRKLITTYEDTLEDLESEVKELQDKLLTKEVELDEYQNTWERRIEDLRSVISGEKPRTSNPRTLGEAIEKHRSEQPDPIGR